MTHIRGIVLVCAVVAALLTGAAVAFATAIPVGTRCPLSVSDSLAYGSTPDSGCPG